MPLVCSQAPMLCPRSSEGKLTLHLSAHTYTYTYTQAGLMQGWIRRQNVRGQGRTNDAKAKAGPSRGQVEA